MKTYPDIFVEIAARYRDRIAVSDCNGSLTYGEMDIISNNIAHFLCSKGLQNSRIIVLLKRTRFVPAIAIGIMRAGACLIPLDADYPAERLRQILEDSGCSCVMTTADLREELCAKDSFFYGVHWGIVEGLVQDFHLRTPINLSAEEAEGILVYTSGSTGAPKGVVHDQRFLPLACLNGWQDEYILSAADVCGCMAGLSFTVIFCDMYSAFTVGARLYIFNEAERMDLFMLRDIIVREQITFMFMPPKLLKSFVEIYKNGPLKCVWTSGEKLQQTLATEYILLEVYGSSEVPGILYRRVLPEVPSTVLGKAAPGCCVYLMDNDGSLIVENGIIGELCAHNGMLANAYLNQPELTSRKFTTMPDGKRIFHTGDLMAWCGNGFLEFHGRNDYMVKLNGMRIELGEVETVALSYSKVQEAVCVLRSINGVDQLCCFVAGDDVSTDDTKGLKEFIASKLPAYMVPSYFVFMVRLPRNLNGKIDRRALPEIDFSNLDTEEYVAPVSDLERELCRAFSELLNIPYEKVSVTGNFFDLGGSSMLAMKLTQMPAFNKLSTTVIFREKTPRNIACSLSENCVEVLTPTDEQEARKERIILVGNQLKIIIDQLQEPDSTVWNVPMLYRLAKNVDIPKLQQSFMMVLSTHPAFRTKLARQGNAYIQYFDDVAEYDIPIIRTSEADFAKQCGKLVQPFIMFDKLLWRIEIYQTEKASYLFCDVHHIMIDGTSVQIMMRHVISYYKGLSVPYYDYYYSFVNSQGIGDTAEAKKYFRKTYGSREDWCAYPAEDFPAESRIEAITGIRASGLLTADLSQAEEKSHISRNVMAVAAGLIALHRQTGCDKVMVSWVYNNRTNRIFDDTIGMLTRDFPVAFDFSKGIEFDELLQSVVKQVIGEVPQTGYDYLVDNYVPFVNDTICINYVGGLRQLSEFRLLFSARMALSREKVTSKTHLGLCLFENDQGEVEIGVEYCRGCYEISTAEKYHSLFNAAFIQITEYLSEKND